MKIHRQLEQVSFSVSDHAQLFDSDRRNRFEPNGLPDSGGAIVVDTFRQSGVRLFTARLFRVLTIFDAQRQSIHTRLEIRRDIKLKRNVTAAVVAHFPTVHPNRTSVIDGAEVEQQVTFVKLFRKLERTRIPNHFVNRLVVDSGKFGLIAKGYDDSPRQLAAVLPTKTQSFIGIVESKLPLAVEIEPDATYKLWAWIF